MVYKSLEIKDLIKDKDDEISNISILKGNNADLKLFNLKKNCKTDIYNAVSNVCIYVLDGEIEIRFQNNECGCSVCGCGIPKKDGNNGNSGRIKKGQLCLFESGMMYWINAIKDSVFFVARM